MNKQDIISHAQDRTEHKADFKINFETELELRISKFVMQKHFWWRRKVFKFQTVANQPLYDFSTMPNAPVDLSFIREFMRYGAGQKPVRVDPVWDDWEVMEAQEDTRTGPPTGFTMEPRGNGLINLDVPPPTQQTDSGDGVSSLNGITGGPLTMRLMPIPDAVYDMKFSYLAAYAIDPTNADPSHIIPPPLHYILVDGLIMDIMSFLYGPENDKFVTAQAEYQAGVQSSFAEGQEFTSKRVDTFVGGDRREPAVSSSSTSNDRNIRSW